MGGWCHDPLRLRFVIPVSINMFKSLTHCPNSYNDVPAHELS